VWTVLAVALVLLLGGGAWFAFETAIGRPGESPEDLSGLSPRAREILEVAIADFRADPAFDHHVHTVGTGE